VYFSTLSLAQEKTQNRESGPKWIADVGGQRNTNGYEGKEAWKITE